jgi:hypothetical protein
MEREKRNRTQMEVIRMPHGDRTGPMGQGPRTGRSAGFCNRYDMAGYADRGAGKMVGGRRNMSAGGGRGHRHWYYATGLPGRVRGGGNFPRSFWGDPTVPPAVSPSEELDMLKDEAGYFEKTLDEIKKHISKLESVPETDKNQTGG